MMSIRNRLSQLRTAVGLTSALVAPAYVAGCSGEISSDPSGPTAIPGGGVGSGSVEAGGMGSAVNPAEVPAGGMTSAVDPATGMAPAGGPAVGVASPNEPAAGMAPTAEPTGMVPADEGVDPGRVTMRRLTPIEYENTVSDLLGFDATGLLRQLPADGRTGGFDNNSTLLGVAPNQLEVFQTAAAQLAQQVVAEEGPARARFFECTQLDDAACQRQILSRFASQAWRRPATPAEVDDLLQLSNDAALQGATPDEQLALAFEAVLTSSFFLFRIEFDPDPSSLQPHPVGQYELASRLSYFLWSSMPDEQLFTLASQERLQDEQQLRAEVTRMLADPKAAALTTNFANQWLGMYMLVDHTVDAAQFPEYDTELRDSMLSQTHSLFDRVLTSGLPVSELVTADDGVPGERLRALYDLPPSTDDTSGSPRAGLGLLGHASVLTLTSYSTRTSVVRRGLWVLENLLCEHPPPPPADLDTDLEGPLAGTLRERMEAHRADPACAGCHRLMDPIGFGLENFDALGRFRESENGEVIDPSGELLGQGEFLGPQDLARLIASDPRLPSCVAEKLMTFALGRQTGASDATYLSQIQGDAGPAPTLNDLIVGVVTSDPFLMRRGEK